MELFCRVKPQYFYIYLALSICDKHTLIHLNTIYYFALNCFECVLIKTFWFSSNVVLEKLLLCWLAALAFGKGSKQAKNLVVKVLTWLHGLHEQLLHYQPNKFPYAIIFPFSVMVMWVNNSDSPFPVGNSALKISDSKHCPLLKSLIFAITFISQVVCSFNTVVQWCILENILKFYVSIFLIKKKQQQLPTPSNRK